MDVIAGEIDASWVKFYLNVVGYKGFFARAGRGEYPSFYLNVVGYKELDRLSRNLLDLVLSERSGI